jgi:formylglycine-generating enzyme required for sulfatase activity
MGDTLDGDNNAIPTNVTVSAFYMDVNLVTYNEWQSVYSWATNNGYGFVNAGAGKATNHPVQSVDWYDCVKWCNARSQQAGLTPVYYTDTNLTQVYTNGEVDIGNSNVDWTANGYRLPTEAEWEKAARGGLSGQRFPWGNTISESQANYRSAGVSGYDMGPVGPLGYNINFYTGMNPFTSPVGYFAPNGYGLYDMAGNVSEWCWDWYGTPYAGGSDPHGPASKGIGIRVLRGGGYSLHAHEQRCAYRNYVSVGPSDVYNLFGFRCVMGH